MQVLQTAVYCVAIFGLLFSVWQYYKNSRRERPRWLFELYQKFYEREDFRQIRKKMEDEISLSTLNNEAGSELDDYFNFFEFVAYLEKQGQLKKQEVTTMFDYPLKLIAKKQETIEYLSKYGYEELVRLLETLKESE